jgi:undecaprenyl diphosphate synthase
VSAVRNIALDVERGLLTSSELEDNSQILLSYLDTAGQPLPDLVVRAGAKEGEVPHTSGFMPMQTAYSGWIFMEDLFPDLTPQALLKSVSNFVEYERRLGT